MIVCCQKKLTLLFVRSDLAEAGDVGVPPATKKGDDKE